MLINRNEKDTREKKKTSILLMEQFLLENGYTDSLCRLEQETLIELSDYEIADNIDFGTVLRDFEEYYQYKYDKKPTYFKKRLQPIAKKTHQTKKHTLPTISKTGTGQDLKENQQKNANAKDSIDDKNNGLQIQGKSTTVASKDTHKENDSWEGKMLQGLPESIKGNEELVALARCLQRDIVTKNPNVRFDQIIGLESCKKVMKEAMLLPLKLSDFFTKNGIDPWSGVLLFGPPGTGKTQIAKGVATECGTTFFNISASSLISKYHG